MAATRKLQGEIDRCLKKVSEGVETFEDIWQKVHNATNSNQKEKYEADLKKEIKKLQRLRDQIKSWIASAEIKDKSTLLDYRKLIETQMERFKVVERETKTKAYSKEGLGAAQKMDPAQKEKEEISTWLVSSIDLLNIQLDQFESEIESLLVGKKKRLDKDKQDRMDELKGKVERHRYHIRKLETLLRMLDNMSVEVDQVLKLNSIHLCSKIRRIKDDVEYYIESSQEPDFEENEYIYDDIEGLDELELAGVVPSSATTDSNGTPNSLTSHSPHSPSMNHSNNLTGGMLGGGNVSLDGDKDEKKPTSHSSNSKSKLLSNSDEVNASKGMVKPTAIRPLSTSTITSNSTSMLLTQASQNMSTLHQQQQLQQQQQTNSSTLISALVSLPQSQVKGGPPPPVLTGLQRGPTPTLPPPNSIPSTPTSNKHGLGAPSTPGGAGSNHHSGPLTPLSTSSTSNFASIASTPPASASASANQQGGLSSHKHLNSSSHHILENGSLPSGPGQGGAPNSGPGSTSNTPSNQSGSAGQHHANNDLGGGSSSSPPSSISSASSPLPLPPSPPASNTQSDHPGELNQPQPTSLKTIAQDALDRAGLIGDNHNPNQETQESYDKSLAPSEAHIPYMLGVVPLGPQPLHKAHHYQYQLVDQAYHHLPTPADSERLRHYITRTPCTTPNYYPQVPLPHSDTLDFFQRLSTESLFFIFYYMEGTKAQYLAAKALKKQSWRFHTKYMMWFQRHEEPKLINEDYEQGTYIYFDNEKWSQRKKEGFTFEYKYLEDRDLN
uniref:CCR4-NOT transcription complex subunit 3 n=1 Tax=Cacopsylla melanoneura TaxID=428564 RepID=A0A8D8WVI2_9HEMI